MLKNIVYLTEEQWQTLRTTGSVVVGDVTHIFDPDNDYRVRHGLSIVYGYLHEGAFYSDSSHIHLIPAEIKKQYIDMTNADNPMSYLWNGDNYVGVGLQPSALTPYRTSANQDVIDDALSTAIGTKVAKSDIVDNLDSTDATKVLSAKQGGHLVDYIDQSISNAMEYVDQQDAAERAGRVAGDEILDGKVAAINGKIPSQASSSNQLADKEFVNSSIATETATFRGTSASGLSETQFLTWANGLTKDNNDYVFWNTTDSAGNVQFKRYKYNGSSWVYEYTLNNSSFTAAQWAAIQSGITSGLVTKLGALPTAEELATALLAKYEKPSSGIPESDLSEGVKEKLNLKEIIYGYLYNGSFYEDSEHTTLITPAAETQYTDLEGNVPYIWDGTEYKAIGGGGDIYETVNLILSSEDESGIEIGADVTLTYADVTETKAYEEGGIRFQIPASMEYTISFEGFAGYATPSSISRTAIAGNQITLMREYAAIVLDVITLNQSITDETAMLDGDINGPVVQWIRANSHLYLGKYTAAGEMSLCQLNDNDARAYFDGTASVLTGADGDVFMKLPVFWWKSTNAGDITTIQLTRYEAEGFNRWDGEKELIGAYEAYSSGNKLYSRSGVNSSGNISQVNFKAYARSRGQGFTIVTWEWHCIMAMLFYCQYGRMNCQAVCGAGTDSYEKATGQRDSLGMTDTHANVDGNNGSIKFWGLENWWGNKWEWVDNVVVNKSSVDDAWVITRHDGTERSVTGMSSAASASYIKKCVLGTHFDLIPITGGGSSTSSYGDAYWYTRSVGRVLLRSGYYANVNGGVAAASANSDSSNTNAVHGSRLAFHGKLEIVEDVSDFKSLTPIG